jgi:hypothetical protein
MAEKYYIEFKANTGEDCRLSLVDSTWTYAATRLYGVGKSPVIREHQTDGEDLFGVFRGCRLICNIIDEGGNGLEEFSTGDAYRWKAVLTVEGNTVFEGYYVPDDLSQQVIYAPNTMQLNFTDGLGLLKNFTLSDTDLVLTTDKYSLLEIINSCLKKTGLELGIKTFGNIYATGLMVQRYDDSAADPFFQADQKIKSYLKGGNNDDEWQDCYTVIERILRDFNATIFQEGGVWNIVRIPELTAGSPAGTSYSFDLYAPSGITGVFNDVLVGQTETIKPVNRSQIKSLIRPASRIVNTYNYTIPQLLCNSALQRLGAQISQTIVGDTTVTEYEVLRFTEQNGQDARIRVTTDNLTNGREISRELYLIFAASEPVGASPKALVSCPIDVNEGDRCFITLNYSGETNSNFGKYFNVGFHLTNAAGSSFRVLAYLNNADPKSNKFYWSTTLANASNVSTGLLPTIKPGSFDITDFTGYDIMDYDYNNNKMARLPFDGTLRIGFFGFNNNTNNKADINCLMNSLQFKYELWINDTTQIIGETHTASQLTDLNSSFEREIFTGDSPKSNIAGTLFVNNVRTTQWTDENYRFGQLSILDEMVIRGISRYKIEGDFRGLLSMYNILAPDFFTGRRFFCNRLVVDYGQGVCNLFADEISSDNDPLRDSFTYEFKYLYE